MDNPVFEDNSEGTAKRNTNFLVQPTHTRSGSCPSKLTQTESARKDHAAFGSHRIKPVRERSSLQGFVFFFFSFHCININLIIYLKNVTWNKHEFIS